MLSRVADSIYWMCRYIERADNIARLIEVNYSFILDLPPNASEQWEPLVNITADDEWFKGKYDAATRDHVIDFLVCNREYPNSIISCLRAARENARSVRETISSETWENLNRFYLMVNEAVQRGPEALASSHEFLAEVKWHSHLFAGCLHNTMSQEEAWHFCQVGTLLERADKTSRILDVKYFHLLPSVQDVGSPLDENQWAALLRSASALEMYRQQFGRIAPSKVIHFLILDRAFPRAMLYAVSRSEESLHAISGTPPGTFSNAAEQRLGQLRSDLAYATTDEVLGTGLHEFLDQFQARLNRVGDAMHDTYFALQPSVPANAWSG
jgi:uncharacterized alpha-E superfamily protein